MEIDERFKLLNREADLVAGMLKGGLGDLQNISKADSFYYEAFYSLSIGFERLLKLILFIQAPQSNLKSYSHDISKLLVSLNITYPNGSIEKNISEFLSDFASKDRYSIPDILGNKSSAILTSEPMHRFSSTIGEEILRTHPIKELILPTEFAQYIHLLHIEEDFSVNADASHLLLIGQKRSHIAKYSTMYMGRLIQKPIEMLDQYSGADHNNPYFYEHFTYLRGDDKYFKNRKTFR